MRIIGGKLKGRNFFMPYGIRATSGIIRKSVFDILGQELDGIDFLDIFSGSGSMGLEAMSRKAQNVTFIEKDIKCVKIIEQNLEDLQFPAKERRNSWFEIIKADAFAAIKSLAKKGKKYDVIFIDPPYSRELAKKALKTLGAYDIVHPNSLVVFQHDKREGLPDREGRFSLLRQRKYGASFITIYKCSKK